MCFNPVPLLRQRASLPAAFRASHSQHKWAKMQAAAFKTSLPRAGVFGGSRVAVGPQRAQLLAPTISRRGTVQVVAAEEQKKKRTPQPEKRAELALERRSRNRSRKSAIATRTKKVCAIRGAVGAVVIAYVSLCLLSLSNWCWMDEWGVACTPVTAATTHSSSGAAKVISGWEPTRSSTTSKKMLVGC